jgi:hypothetical protein
MTGPFEDYGAAFSVALDVDWGVVGGESSATTVRLSAGTEVRLTSPNEEPSGSFG